MTGSTEHIPHQGKGETNMAHEIQSAVFMASQGAGWTGLGRAIPAEIAKDPRKIAELCNALYEVKAAPLYYDVNTVPQTYYVDMIDSNGQPMSIKVTTPGLAVKERAKDYTAQVRADTNSLLSVTSANRYHTTHRQPSDIFEAFRDQLMEHGWEISHAAVLRGGQIVAVSAILPDDYDIIVGKGDRLKKYVTLSTGYNPRANKSGTNCTNGTIRVVCANTLAASLIAAERTDQLRTIRASTELEFGDLAALVDRVKDLREAEVQAFNELANRQMSETDVARFFADVLEIDISKLNTKNANGKDDVSTRAKNMLASLAKAYREAPGATIAQGTAWGALHAVTYYGTHEKTVRDTKGDGDDVARAASNMIGDAAALKARALQLIMNRARVAA